MQGLNEEWRVEARCAGMDTDSFYGEINNQREVLPVCRPCGVRLECLATALDDSEEFGAWGGMTDRSRKVLLRRYPDVRSWWGRFDRQLRGGIERGAIIYVTSIGGIAVRKRKVDGPVSPE